jgi:hypothetical protein
MTSTVTIFVKISTGCMERGVQNKVLYQKLNILINTGNGHKEEKNTKFEFRSLLYVYGHCAF